MDICEVHAECGVRSIENGRTVITINGIQFVKDSILGRGSNGTVVYEGGRAWECNSDGEITSFCPAAVKCLTKEQFDLQVEGFQNHLKAKYHANIISLYANVEKAKGFVFIALGLCDYDLHRFLVQNYDQGLLFKENGYPSSLLLQLMRDIVSGLDHLHGLGIIHRDLKPSHVLILRDEGRAQLSGMGRSRKSSLGRRDATKTTTTEWKSPEEICKWQQTPAMDVFNLGCVFFFIFSKGKHPFGDDVHERDINVANNNMVNFSLVEHIPEVAKDLLFRLLEFKPERRPQLSEVLGHPLFWNNLKRLNFLVFASERAESKDKIGISIAAELESKCDEVFSKTTFEADPIITRMVQDISFRVRSGKVQDLLSVIRKTIRKYPTSIQELVGPYPEGLDNYIRCTFPNLLTVVYNIMHQHCKEDMYFLRCYVDDNTGPMIVSDASSVVGSP